MRESFRPATWSLAGISNAIGCRAYGSVGSPPTTSKRLWIWVAAGSAHRDLGQADGRHLRGLAVLAEWSGVPKAFDARPWGGDVLMLHPRDGDYSRVAVPRLGR